MSIQHISSQNDPRNRLSTESNHSTAPSAKRRRYDGSAHTSLHSKFSILDMSDDALSVVFTFLPFSDLTTIAEVCQRWLKNQKQPIVSSPLRLNHLLQKETESELFIKEDFFKKIDINKISSNVKTVYIKISEFNDKINILMKKVESVYIGTNKKIFMIKENVNFVNCQSLVSFFRGKTVLCAQNVDLQDCHRLKHLPDYLEIIGVADFSGCRSLEVLPRILYVGRSLFMQNMSPNLKWSSEECVIAWDLYLSEEENLIPLPDRIILGEKVKYVFDNE